MDRIDVMLEEFFAPEAPRDLASRLLGGLRARRVELEALADRFRIEATERGVARLRPGRGNHGTSARARAHAERARRQRHEDLAGPPTVFTVAGGLAGVAHFQAPVLAEGGRIPFREVDSHAALAR